MKYYIQLSSKWYAFVRIFISSPKFFLWLIKRVCEVISAVNINKRNDVVISDHVNGIINAYRYNKCQATIYPHSAKRRMR